ncbi:NAD(+) diphosphatase [Pseudolysinimonas sp.]|jgi:NAD+ diphosphatase|uniref:NAD(+) diphosphatase n=1 Tax=Pseudolysinimonas sp. TaxID=2680009 RepID=UPI0037847949
MSDTPAPTPFSARLPLARAALDRDHLGRAGGIDGLLDDARTRAIVLHEGKALLASPTTLAILPPSVVPQAALAVYLGRTTTAAPDLAVGTPIVALAVDSPDGFDELDDVPTGPAEWGDLRRIGARLDERDAGLFTQALAILNWHTVSRFSPLAGGETRPGKAGWVREDETGKEYFPRTDSAVIVGVTDHDDRLLLGSNAMWEAKRFSLLAGFVEPGESLEAAVIREVFEESGVRVENPQYLGSQPWPFPASLMVGFVARAVPGADTAGEPDGEEIVALRWFTRDELTAAVEAGDVILPGPTSIARAIIEHWYGGEIADGARTWG